MGSPVTETKPILINKKFMEFLTKLASADNPLEGELKLIEFVEGYLKELIEEQHKFLVSEVPCSKLLLNNAIETLKKGIVQFKIAVHDKRTDLEPNARQSFLSQNLKPHQQQETGCNQRKSWSNELHEKFVYCLEQLVDFEDAQNSIKELMKVEGLTNREVDVMPSSQISYQQTVPSLNQQSNSTNQEIASLKETDEVPVSYSRKTRKEQIARYNQKKFKRQLASRDKQLEAERSRRRNVWSYEQHTKFENLLPSLGGLEGATPERVLELMQDDELTIEDVNNQIIKYTAHLQMARNARIMDKSELGSFSQTVHKEESIKDELDDSKEDEK